MKLVNGKLVNDDDEPATVDDITPTATETPAGDGVDRCEECGVTLYYAGKGRHPRYCEDHKPVSPNRSRIGGTQPRRSATLRNEAALRESLAARYLMLSNIAALRHPAYANGIRDKIDRAVEADIAYAKVNPSFRRVLESALEKTAAAEVVAVHVSMFAPVIVGEAAKRGRKKADVPSRGEAHGTSPNPSRQPTQPRPQQPAPQQRPTVTHLFPGEHVGDGDAETTEYDTLPDADTMPGV